MPSCISTVPARPAATSSLELSRCGSPASSHPAREDARPADPAQIDAESAADAAPRLAARACWASEQLFGGRHEIQIAHGESVYRLRITALGKLILTK